MSTPSPNPSKKSLRNAGAPLPSSAQSVKFARRTSSGRLVSLSREEINLSGDYMSYSVHIPPTPDNQPMDEPAEAQSAATKAEEQYVSSSLFTGGFNSATRAHLMDKVIDSAASHPQMAGAKSSSSCAVPACDGKVMADERGADILPCECRFKICRDCYLDALKETGNCPGCKEPYRVGGDYDEEGTGDASKGGKGKPALPPSLSKAEPSKSLLLRSQTGGDFDHNRWLFETQGTYGYGSAFWPKEGVGCDDDEEGEGGGMGGADGMPEMLEKPWKPLTRVIPMPAAIIQPYRLLILVRFVALFFFLSWRIQHPNVDAPWLWGMSVVCEVWFAFSWILDQAPKLHPINRTTDLMVSLYK